MSKDFRSTVTRLENNLKSIADGKNIIANNGDIVYHEKYKYKHTFADSIYVREMTIEKGEIIMGAIHKHLHVWFLLSGHVTVLTEDKLDADATGSDETISLSQIDSIKAISGASTSSLEIFATA